MIHCVQVDLLHPLAATKWEICHTWKYCFPTHCAVLRDKVAVLAETRLSTDILYVSSLDLSSWTTVNLPYQHMSLTTYKSQFVAVGGLSDVNTPVDVVLTSGTGLDWYPTLLPMKTKRFYTGSVGATSPEVLVVAGGIGLVGGDKLDTVEVLIEDNWHFVAPLPEPASEMTLTIHQDEVVFSSKRLPTIFSCNVASLVSSSTTTSTSPLWRHYVVPYEYFDVVTSHFSRLICTRANIVKSWCNTSQSWVKATTIREKNKLFLYTMDSGATLPNGDIITIFSEGVCKVEVSGKL